ncbi:MAG: contact-dependent growth inhibition system immunity protein [Vicinamibacteraceae bacterium]
MRSQTARKRAKPRRTSRILVSAFPELTHAFQGYLHEDFSIEHGSAREAIAAYKAEASDEERARFGREAVRFVSMVRGTRISAVRRVLAREFRSAWSPRSMAELRGVLCAEEEDDTK